MTHQREGVAFLLGSRRGLLAFEQGLGKTLVAIDAFRNLRSGQKVDRLLVICPNSLKRNWIAEIAKFAPDLSTEVAEGNARLRRRTFAESAVDVVITSYETARVEVTAILALLDRARTVLVLDESHAAKNWKSLTSSSIRHLAPHSDYRWLLSGTPVTNTAADLFTQLEIIAPGERPVGSLESFLAQVDADPTAAFAREVLDEFILRRTKEECLDLPDKMFSDVVVELPHWQRRLYDNMRTEMVCQIRSMNGEEYRAFAATALAKLTRLTQLASNPSLLLSSISETPAKFEVLDGLLADILSVPDRKVIIWSNYVRNIEALMERFGGYGAAALYGAIDTAERQDVAERFQNDPSTRVLIANAAAAGTGFTLTAASYTIYESISWRFDHYAQSQDRNHRIGQTKPVNYLRLVAADTIDEAICDALERKGGLARSLLSDGTTGPNLSRLTPDQMCDLLTHNRLPS